VHPYRAWPFLSVPQHPVLSAGWALLVHGVVGVAVLWPILRSSERKALYTAVVFAGASLIDVDHVVAAGSLNPHSLESMSGRPETHGLLVAAGLALLALVLTRRAIVAWSVFAVTTSHLVFDAAGGGTPLLAPFSGLEAVPWLAVPAGVGLLAAVSALLARGAVGSLPDAHPVDEHAGRERGGGAWRPRPVPADGEVEQ
jgi:hypothetical protein